MRGIDQELEKMYKINARTSTFFPRIINKNHPRNDLENRKLYKIRANELTILKFFQYRMRCPNGSESFKNNTYIPDV